MSSCYKNFVHFTGGSEKMPCYKMSKKSLMSTNNLDLFQINEKKGLQMAYKHEIHVYKS